MRLIFPGADFPGHLLGTAFSAAAWRLNRGQEDR